MVPIVIGRGPAEVVARRARARAMFPGVPADEAGWRAAGFLQGTPEQVIDQLRRWSALGCLSAWPCMKRPGWVMVLARLGSRQSGSTRGSGFG